MNPVEFQAVKLRNQESSLIALSVPDKTFSLDHLMRLPDAVNVLTEEKAKKGYPPGNQLARNRPVGTYERRYDLHQFEPAEPEKPTAAKTTASAALPGVSNRRSRHARSFRVRRRSSRRSASGHQGRSRPIEFGGDRSNAVFHVCCALILRADVPETAIVANVLDKRFRISDHLFNRIRPTRASMPSANSGWRSGSGWNWVGISLRVQPRNHPAFKRRNGDHAMTNVIPRFRR